MSAIAPTDAAIPDAPAIGKQRYIVRIELSGPRRRHLGAMARDAGLSVDAMASGLLETLIDDDAAAEKPPAAAAPAVGAPKAPKAAKPKPAPRPDRIAPDARPPAEANGVRVDFALSVVTYRGRETDVSTRQAEAVAVLARAMPNWIPRSEIGARAWPDLAESSASNTLAMMREPLQQRMERIGLTLKVVTGLGLALQAKEDPA